MAANLRRGNLPTEATMARFMYYIVKQLDVRGVDWSQVAEDMEITNGHAARMRYARYKNQVEGVQPRPREPRVPGAAKDKKGPGRPVKKQKMEKKEEDGDVKKDPDAAPPKSDAKAKVKRENSVDGKKMPEAKMGGALGPGAGIKREYNDGEVDGTLDNHMDLTMQTASTSEAAKSPARKGSGVKVKSEPTEDGTSPKSGGNTVDESGEADAPGESIDPAELSAMTLGQQYTSDTQPPPPSSRKASTSTKSPQLQVPQPQQATNVSPVFNNGNGTVPSMQHLQLSHTSPNPRIFANDHSHTPPPPIPTLTAHQGGQGGYTHLNMPSYPTPAYQQFPQVNTMQGQSPATTSSAPFSMPPSPLNEGLNTSGFQNGYDFNNNGAGGYDITAQAFMMNGNADRSYVSMLRDPSFPGENAQAQFYPSANGNGDAAGFGGWGGMYQ